MLVTMASQHSIQNASKVMDVRMLEYSEVTRIYYQPIKNNLFIALGPEIYHCSSYINKGDSNFLHTHLLSLSFFSTLMSFSAKDTLIMPHIRCKYTILETQYAIKSAFLKLNMQHKKHVSQFAVQHKMQLKDNLKAID